MRRLIRPFLVLLAIIFLIEAWLWRHLEPVVESIVARIPLRALKLRVAAWIDTMPPPAALIVFVVPGILLFPLKLLTLWLLAQKQLMAAGLVFTFAKLVGLGVTAFVFEATRPKLMQMAWFRWLYGQVLIALAWAHQLVDPVRQRVRKFMQVFAPKRAGRAMRLFWRIRRRMRSGAPVRTDAPRAAQTAQSP
jgi:hypothetical protein